MNVGANQLPRVVMEIPEWGIPFLTTPARYKVAHGGRGGGKSWTFARALIAQAHASRHLIGCFREVQASMRDSVHSVLRRQIHAMGLQDWFVVTQTSIKGRAHGSEFIFRGFRNALDSIRSIEGLTRAWVEEAETVSDASWETLIPTVRAPNSEMWISFNQKDPNSPTRRRFVLRDPAPGNSLQMKINFDSNPYFPEELDRERRHMFATDLDAYAHVWLGEPQTITDAVVLKGKVAIESFPTPERASYLWGADWGFSQDPTVLLKMFIEGNALFVEDEVYGVGVELDQIATMFKKLDGVERGTIYADSARPETISYLRRTAGLDVRAADKWKGSVQDGIAHLRGFDRIVVHERCKRTADECSLYSYKTDQYGRITTDLIDRHNHCIDSMRYGLNNYIQRRGSMELWRKLAR